MKRAWVPLVPLTLGCSPGPEVLQGRGYDPPPQTTSPAPHYDLPAYACASETVRTERHGEGSTGWAYAGYDEAAPTRMLYRAADWNGNGIIELVEDYTWDEAGNLTLVEGSRSDGFVWEYRYDDRSNLLYEKIAAQDGLVYSLTLQEWDAADRLTYTSWDYLGSGPVEEETWQVWSADGALLERIERVGDEVEVHWFVTDAAGRPSTVTLDLGDDGVPDELHTYTYTDPALAIGEVTVDHALDGTIDEHWRIEHDVAGRQLYLAQDIDLDGDWEYEYAAAYDPSGRRLSLSLSMLVDNADQAGAPYVVEQTESFDALGRPLRATDRRVLDGELIRDREDVTTYGGSCP
jgi:hypothetical protein